MCNPAISQQPGKPDPKDRQWGKDPLQNGLMKLERAQRLVNKAARTLKDFDDDELLPRALQSMRRGLHILSHVAMTFAPPPIPIEPSPLPRVAKPLCVPTMPEDTV